MAIYNAIILFQADNLTHSKDVKRYTKRLRKFLARQIVRFGSAKQKQKSWENTMTDNKDKPLDKQTKREILEQICTQKGWDIKSDLATSLNRSSKLVLIEWHKDLI